MRFFTTWVTPDMVVCFGVVERKVGEGSGERRLVL